MYTIVASFAAVPAVTFDFFRLAAFVSESSPQRVRSWVSRSPAGKNQIDEARNRIFHFYPNRMNTDPIADLLTRMRNAVKARQTKTVVPHSTMKMAILEVIKKRKFIQDFKVVKNGEFNEIEITFNPEIKELSLKRVSKPGQRIYVGKGDIKSVHYGYGIALISTPKGVMEGREAMKAGMGGEFLCEVW